MSKEVREHALDAAAMSKAQGVVWAVCIGVYLTVFIGGIQAGGAELITLGRAIAFTLAAAVLGRVALGLLGRASLPVEKGPTADQEGPLGSLADLMASTKVAQHEDKAEAAVLLSRATDERDQVQPSWAEFSAARAVGNDYHNNHVRGWRVRMDGRVGYERG